MRLIDIAKNIDKSEKNECFVDLSVLQQELGLPEYGDAEQDRLKAYWVESWLCTDSCVGGRMYFFDDKPVAYSYQSGRKNDEQFAWFSQEAAERVRDFVQGLHKEELRVRVCDINEDIGDSYKIEYNDEVLDWSMARYQGKLIELVEKLHGINPAYRCLESTVRIRVPADNEELVVDVKDLDFLFHINDGQEKLVDDLIANAADKCEALNNGAHSKETVEIGKD